MTAAEARTSSGGKLKDDCEACQPFSRLVNDPERLDACMALAKGLGDLRTPEKLFQLVRGNLERQDQEVFAVLCLDFRGHLRSYAEVGRGQRHRVAVDVEDVLRFVIASGPDGFVVCHNHPSGIAEPSEADGKLTEAIQEAAKKACPSVHFLDHLVIGRGQFYSFAANDWKDNGKPSKV